MARRKEQTTTNPEAPTIVAPIFAEITVSLDKLTVAPENPRAKDPPDDQIASLAESIAATGCIQPMIVRTNPDDPGAYLVVAGRRRLLAFQALVALARVPADQAIPARLVAATADTAAIGLIENLDRVQMSEPAIWRAMAAMDADGKNTEHIALSFGRPVRSIQQHVALGRLPEHVLAHYGHRADLKFLAAIAQIKDPLKRDAVYEHLEDPHFQHYVVMSLIQQDKRTPSWTSYRIIGSSAYAAAGGTLTKDLFEDALTNIDQPDLVTTLIGAWLQSTATTCENLGFGKPLTTEPVWEPDTEDLNATFTREGGDYEAVQAAARMPDVPTLDATEEDIAAYQSHPVVFFTAVAAAIDPEVLARCEPVIRFYSHGCQLGVKVRPVEHTDDQDDLISTDTDTDQVPSDTQQSQTDEPQTTTMTHALTESLTRIATQLFAAEVAEAPNAAMVLFLTTTLATFAQIRRPGQGDNLLDITPRRFSRTSYDSGLPGAFNEDAIEQIRTLADGSFQGLLTAIAAMSASARMTLFANVIASCITASTHRNDMPRTRAQAQAQALNAALMNVQPDRLWAPDTTVLSQFNASQLREALIDMGEADIATNGMKKGALVALVADKAASHRWLHPAMRLVPAPKPEPEITPLEALNRGDEVNDEACPATNDNGETPTEAAA
jgi:ParB family transcriptional regulator, chromosome partitioning protein